jgi:hypothetical protein
MDEKIAKKMEELNPETTTKVKEALAIQIKAQEEAEEKVRHGSEGGGVARRQVSEGRLFVHQALNTFVVDHMVNEDEEKWRCSVQGCTKLFKASDFLNKHIRNKHGAHAEATSKAVGPRATSVRCSTLGSRGLLTDPTEGARGAGEEGL